MSRIYANEPSRWTRHCSSLMAILRRTKGSTTRQRGRRTKHLFDWMAHSSNLANGETPTRRYDRSLCSFCGHPETQPHINTSFSHPPLVEARQMVKRKVNEFFMSYPHRHLPQNHRWVVPLIDYMEEHLWFETVRASDIWNGKWTRDDSTVQISSNDFNQALSWLTNLYQKGQQTLYGVRRTELLAKEAKERFAAVISLRKKRPPRERRSSMPPGNFTIIVPLNLSIGKPTASQIGLVYTS